METSRMYIGNELSDTTAQKIISKLVLMRILMPHEAINALFGKTLLYSADNTLVFTEDSLKYSYYPTVFSTYKTISIPFADIANIDLQNHKNQEIITLTIKNGKKIDIKIHADKSETERVFNYLKDYKFTVNEYKSLDTVAVRCPNCGASNAISKGGTGICSYCGSKLIDEPEQAE